jgi:hypothetical protein
MPEWTAEEVNVLTRSPRPGSVAGQKSQGHPVQVGASVGDGDGDRLGPGEHESNRHGRRQHVRWRSEPFGHVELAKLRIVRLRRRWWRLEEAQCVQFCLREPRKRRRSACQNLANGWSINHCFGTSALTRETHRWAPASPSSPFFNPKAEK